MALRSSPMTCQKSDHEPTKARFFYRTMAGRHPEGSRTNSVTHINSFSNEKSDKPLVDIVELMGSLASGVAAPQKMDGFQRNPTLVKQEATAMQTELNRARDSLEDALAEAEKLKAATNAIFSKGDWKVALVGYVAALWLLRGGKSPCPLLVANSMASGTTEDALWAKRIVDVAAAVTLWVSEPEPAAAAGAAAGAAPVDVSDGGEAATAEAATAKAATADPGTALRTSLLLNLAAAALKLTEWHLAKAACESVLANEEARFHGIQPPTPDSQRVLPLPLLLKPPLLLPLPLLLKLPLLCS